MTGDGHLTAALQTSIEGPFRRDAGMGGGIVERGDQGSGSGVVQPTFHPDRPLADGRQAEFRRQGDGDAFRQSQPLQAGGGQDDGVELARIQFRQPAVDVAAQAMNPPAWITGRQLTLPAQAGGADPRVGRQDVGVGISVGNEGVARVLARQNHGEPQAGGEIHRHVFHGMDGEIGVAVQQTLFQFLDEQALAADLGQRAVEDLVAASDHADQFDPQLGMKLAQARGDVFGLPERERTFTGGDAQDIGRHDFVKLWLLFI